MVEKKHKWGVGGLGGDGQIHKRSRKPLWKNTFKTIDEILIKF